VLGAGFQIVDDATSACPISQHAMEDGKLKMEESKLRSTEEKSHQLGGQKARTGAAVTGGGS
jgi:hypothetical protein